MTEIELKTFLDSWNAANKLYGKYCSGNHFHFPEPLQKNILMSLYDTSLQLESSLSSYDFKGNVEMKSSTKQGGGCTPFSENQNNCSRIIYLEIADYFDVYEIDSTDVNSINALVRNGNTNISLKNYLGKAKRKRIV